MSVNKNLLCTYLKTMLDNIRQGMPDTGKPYALRMFAGSDATITVTAPGGEPIVMKHADCVEPVPTIMLVDAGCVALEQFIGECNKDVCIGEQVGVKAIEDEVKRLLRQWIGKTVDDKAMATDVRGSLQRMRAQVQPWTVYFSIDNLTLKGMDDFVLGGVRLVPTAACGSDLKTRLRSQVDRSASDSKTKDAVKIRFDDQVDEFYPVNGTVAILTVEAEQSHLRTVADRALGEVFGVLRGFTHLMFRRKSRCLFGLNGWLISKAEAWVSASVDGTQSNLSVARVGALGRFELTPANVQHLREHCALATLHTILCRTVSERTQLERTVVVAAQWHGAAVNSLTRAEEFVWHTVALERLLICDNEGSTTERFAKRLAWLLGSSGEERQYLVARASRLYNTRSRIVHAGETRVELDDLQAIDMLASRAVIALAERTAEWKTQKEMAGWVEGQLVGA